MENVKLGKLFDDEGESISDVEKVLNQFGISLRDKTTKQFRDLGVVLDETMGKWQELEKAGKTTEQSAIAVAFAGTRQANVFRTLMGDQEKYRQALALEANSLGQTNKAYTAYTQNVEASQKRMTAAWEAMWSRILNSEVIKFFYDLGASILDATKNMSGLIVVVDLLTTALIVLKSQAIATSLITFWGGITTAIGGMVTNITTALAVYGSFRGLVSGLAASITGLLNPAVAALALTVGAVVLVWNQWNEQIVKTNQQGLEATDNAWKSFFESAVSKGKNAVEVLDMYQQAVARVNKQIDEGGIAGAFVDRQNIIKQSLNGVIDALSKTALNWNDYQEKVKKAVEAAGYQIDENGKVYRNIVNMNGRVIKDYIKDINSLTEAEVNAAIANNKNVRFPGKEKDDLGVGLTIDTETPKTLQELLTLLDQSMADLIPLNEQMHNLVKSFDEYGQLGIDQVEQLRKSFGDDYYKALVFENGQIKLNKAALQELIIEKAKEAWHSSLQALATAINTNAKQEEIQKIQALVIETRTYYEQLKNGTELSITSIEEQKKAYDDLLKTVVDMIKQQKEAEKQALQDSLTAFKDQIDEKKKALEDEADKQKQVLQDQLEGYQKIIQAEKDLIDQKRDQEKFQDKVAAKNKEISDIDAQLLALQFDNSEAAKAKRLQLEADKAAKLKELEELQKDQTAKNQKDALDKELKEYEEQNKKKQQIIDRNLKSQKDALDKEYKLFEDNINAKIKAIDDYLKQTNTINADAMKMLESRTKTFYDSLLAWNKQFGQSVQDDIIKWLDIAFQKKVSLGSDSPWGGIGKLETELGEDLNGNGIIGYHSGGIVGGKATSRAGEVFIKALKGEVIANDPMISNFFSKALPSFVANLGGGAGETNIELNVNVAGSLDKSVLPDLKNQVFTVINDALKTKGIRRDAFSFSAG